MADPAAVTCAKGAWTKVATNKTSGTIQIIPSNNSYLQTHRDTGSAAPTLRSEGVPFLGEMMKIDYPTGIDVYIWAIGNAGSVVVSL